MTPDQELSLVKMYSSGIPYKVISKELALPVHTLSSCIRRKYKNLQSQIHEKQRILTQVYTKKFKDDLNVTDTVAQVIFENMYERFQTKKKNTKFEFDLKFSDLSFPLTCPLLNIPLNYLEENFRADNYPTFDRIDSKKGYVKGNVHVVSWRANRIKCDATQEELELIAHNLKMINH